MKKSDLHSTALAVAIALSPAIHAQSADPAATGVTTVGEWDGFSSATNIGQRSIAATMGSGSLSLSTNAIVSQAGILHQNSATQIFSNYPTVDLSSVSGLNMETGVSVSVQLANLQRLSNSYQNRIIFSLGTQANQNALALNLLNDADDTDQIQIGFNGSMNNVNQVVPKQLSSVASPTTPVVVTMTIQWDATNSNVVFKVYENGSEILSTTSKANGNNTTQKNQETAKSQITRLSLSAWAGGNSATGMSTQDAYRLNISSGAMTAEEVMDLYTRWTTPQAKGGAPGPDMHEPAAVFHAASLTALGSAQHDGMINQLAAIRNRLVSITAMPNTMAMPVQAGNIYSLWVEATGGYAELQHSDSSAAGYEMSSYGGILGGNLALTDNLNVGAALAVDYGKVNSHLNAEPGTGHFENGSGNLNAYYLNLFARYRHDSWVHLLVLTGALQQADMDRMVQIAPHYYSATGSTNGYGLAAMYELTYDIVADESNTSILQPLLNLSVVKTHLNSYAETASDPQFSLNVGSHDRTTFTAAVGARWLKQWQSSVVGRHIVTELRATVSQDFGDDRSTITGSLANDNLISFTQQGANAGKTAGQIGLGITVPSHVHGSVFANVNGEWRSNSYNVTGAIGYRYDF